MPFRTPEFLINMTAYVVAQIEIEDPEEYQKYLDGFPPSFQRHGGKILATTKNATEVVEGDWAYPRTVILEFPSVEAAHNWHSDPEYAALASHRHNAANTNAVVAR